MFPWVKSLRCYEDEDTGCFFATGPGWFLLLANQSWSFMKFFIYETVGSVHANFIAVLNRKGQLKKTSCIWGKHPVVYLKKTLYFGKTICIWKKTVFIENTVFEEPDFEWRIEMTKAWVEVRQETAHLVFLDNQDHVVNIYICSIF